VLQFASGANIAATSSVVFPALACVVYCMNTAFNVFSHSYHVVVVVVVVVVVDTDSILSQQYSIDWDVMPDLLEYIIHLLNVNPKEYSVQLAF